MKSKVLATIGFGPMEPVLDQAFPTFADFADRHGYDVVRRSTNDDAHGRPPSWGKVRLIRRLLETYDLVLWVDADAIILDGSSDPADALGPDDYQALVELHQLGQAFPTCGVWLLRSTDKAKAFLDAIWEKDEYTNDRYWEQAAALDLLGYSIHPAHRIRESAWMEGTRLLGEEWNRMPLITRALEPCRIRHYAGEDNAVRRRRMIADRHGLAAGSTTGWRRSWHTLAAAGGDLRWRLWDGPMGPFGAVRKLHYRATGLCYGVARTVGIVTLVRALQGRTGPTVTGGGSPGLGQSRHTEGLPVETGLLRELLPALEPFHPPVPQHEDPVADAERRQAVGDDDDGRLAAELAEGDLNVML